jgi:hypothetical protein
VQGCDNLLLLSACDEAKGESAGHTIHLLSKEHDVHDAGYTRGPHATLLAPI